MTTEHTCRNAAQIRHAWDCPCAECRAKSEREAGERREREQSRDWHNHTPDDVEYCLTMFDSDGDTPEDIRDLTRREYIALKMRLAELRGINHELSEED
jgi:hypothetical protein